MADMERLLEKAKELGEMLGRTEEYQTLRRARESVGEDGEIPELAKRLAELEREMVTAMRNGDEPADEIRSEHDALVTKLQASSIYQSLVAAESNFEKIVGRVNERMGDAMESGSRSGLILPG